MPPTTTPPTPAQTRAQLAARLRDLAAACELMVDADDLVSLLDDFRAINTEYGLILRGSECRENWSEHLQIFMRRTALALSIAQLLDTAPQPPRREAP